MLWKLCIVGADVIGATPASKTMLPGSLDLELNIYTVFETAVPPGARLVLDGTVPKVGK